jgi:outer membrane protein assembly factor BamB
MKTWQTTALKAVALLCVAAGSANVSIRADDPPTEKPQTKVDTPTLDMADLSIPVRLEEGTAQAERFPLGHIDRKGWYARVAGANPRSPDTENGVVVVGSGSGSEVYGYDVESGARKWTAANDDAGISSIVIEDGYAYYTTHSCTLEKIRVADGKKEYTTYLAPTVECAPDVKEAEVATAVSESGTWRVGLRETGTGKRKWDAPLGHPGVVTGPIIMGGNVYVTTIDGRLTRLSAATGNQDWAADVGSVSAPVATPWGLLVTTTWDGDEARLQRRTADQRKKRNRQTSSEPDAEAGTVIAHEDRQVALIENPFVEPRIKAGADPRGPHTSMDYQGVRPGVTAKHIILAYKGEITAVDPLIGRADWSVKIDDESCSFATPVAHRGLVFVASNTGIVTAIEESTGAIIWSYRFTENGFAAEPAIDDANLLLTTADGLVICIPTGAGTVDAGAPKVVRGDAERTAAAYWPLQREFRKSRETGEVLVPEPAVAAQVQDGGKPQNTAPTDTGSRNEGIRPREERPEQEPRR